MRTSTVMTIVANATALSPKVLARRAVVNEVARILTRLLPKSTEPIKRSLSSVISNARCAPLEPLSACALSLPREAAVSAVSLPEKNPDKTSSPAIAATENQKFASIMDVVGSISFPCVWALAYAVKMFLDQDQLRLSFRSSHRWLHQSKDCFLAEGEAARG